MTAPVRALGCPSVGPFLTPTGILCVPLGAPSRGWRGLGGNSVRCSAPAAFMALQKSSPVAAGCFWCLLRASLCKLLSPWHMLWRARKKAGGKKSNSNQPGIIVGLCYYSCFEICSRQAFIQPLWQLFCPTLSFSGSCNCDSFFS